MFFTGERKKSWIKEYNKKYYLSHRVEICSLENRKRRRITTADWKKRNADRVRLAERLRLQKRRKEDPRFHLTILLRNRIRLAMKVNVKNSSTFTLLGCTIDQLCGHLEIQFRPGMSWENYGPVWHVDHIRPCASFDLTNPEAQKQCFHYSNLQPLFAEENLRKGPSCQVFKTQVKA